MLQLVYGYMYRCMHRCIYTPTYTHVSLDARQGAESFTFPPPPTTTKKNICREEDVDKSSNTRAARSCSLNGSFYKMGVLFWAPYLRDPMLLGPHSVPLVFGNCRQACRPEASRDGLRELATTSPMIDGDSSSQNRGS